MYDLESSDPVLVSDTLPLKERYRHLLYELWTLWETTVCGEALRCFIAESQLNVQNMAYMVDEFMIRRFELPRKLLEQGVERGELKSDTDIDLLLDMSFGFCWFHLLTNKLTDRTRIDAFIEQLFD